jgi:drug/metabolite transporter (DMT)-like permease
MRRSALARDPLAYGMVVGSYLLMAATAALVDYTSAPEAVVLCLRMSFAALALAVVFARRGTLADWRRPGAAPRLLIMGAVSSGTLLMFFFAIRSTDVAIAMILLFMMPVWVALLAPRVFGIPREPIVYPALVLALAGLGVILAPELMGGDLRASAWGLAAGLGSGLGYTAYALLVKDLTKYVSSPTISLAETSLAVLFTLPLAFWQYTATAYRLTGTDVVIALIMGVICTSFAYTIWIEATRRVRVEHVTLLGYLEPVAAPVYALVLLGQRPGVWTMAGGALIIAAGLLVVMFGRTEGETVTVEPEPL